MCCRILFRSPSRDKSVICLITAFRKPTDEERRFVLFVESANASSFRAEDLHALTSELRSRGVNVKLVLVNKHGNIIKTNPFAYAAESPAGGK